MLYIIEVLGLVPGLLAANQQGSARPGTKLCLELVNQLSTAQLVDQLQAMNNRLNVMEERIKYPVVTSGSQ